MGKKCNQLAAALGCSDGCPLNWGNLLKQVEYLCEDHQRLCTELDRAKENAQLICAADIFMNCRVPGSGRSWPDALNYVLHLKQRSSLTVKLRDVLRQALWLRGTCETTKNTADEILKRINQQITEIETLATREPKEEE